MTLQHRFDRWKSELPTSLTPEQETMLIYHIIETADHITPDAIAKHLISPVTAWDVVSNDDDMWETALSNSHIPKQLAYRATVKDADNIHKLAYMLAYENPELATQLLNELLYYRYTGRI